MSISKWVSDSISPKKIRITVIKLDANYCKVSNSLKRWNPRNSAHYLFTHINYRRILSEGFYDIFAA